MLDAKVLAVRQMSVIEYLKLLEAASHRPWQELATLDSLPARLLLCHPQWLDDPAGMAGLGLVSFMGRGVGGRCQSVDLWGYECPLTEEGFEADHLFPRSLGGPATAANQVWLCRVHNQWKGTDLIHFPWERGRPSWLDQQVERMATFVDPGQVINR